MGQGQKGRQITKILSIDDSVVTLLPPRNAPSGAQPARAGNAPDASTAIDMLGTVKWFTLEKGMGFVEVDGGDVFVHISVAERAQLANLAEGQRVAMRVVETQKGRQAVSITLADWRLRAKRVEMPCRSFDGLMVLQTGGLGEPSRLRPAASFASLFSFSSRAAFSSGVSAGASFNTLSKADCCSASNSALCSRTNAFSSAERSSRAVHSITTSSALGRGPRFEF